ncbi:Pyrroline-5-carboxylate reductase [hydrothermal vent metagenome]|uniref:Pyrroline-5-carboxylate reductase n=1 Tax=hydrothermal vent metagenome TaxID=652676 RepID=A0A3B0YFH8_9ZZZZ
MSSSNTSDKPTISFIGAGNMASSLIGGMLNDGWPCDKITIADPNKSQREQITSRYAVHSTDNNIVASSKADIIVLAVKPQILKAVCQNLASDFQHTQTLIVSIAAGIRETDINRWLGGNRAIVRCMPNTPALVGSGMSGLFANSAVSEQQKSRAENILRSVGVTLWLNEESMLDSVTALSGSGPAYIFLVIEALQEAGVALGLDENTARLLAIETTFGAAKMALESSSTAKLLRQQVTSPGGTTERALEVLQSGGLVELFESALQAAKQRSIELADKLGA